jgi:NAD(P)-dependent dehydrogenase (short-subunit alcohol dehydrogenase family)
VATGATGGISRAVARRLADGFAVSMNQAGHAQAAEETVAESNDEHTNA